MNINHSQHPVSIFLTICLLLILSGPLFHTNLKNIFSNFLSRSPGGLGKARNKYANLESMSDFITMTLPIRVNFLFDQVLIILLTFFHDII